MSDLRQSVMEEFIVERLGQYEKFFSTPLWKKSLYPFLKAHLEIANRSLLQGTTHMEIDVQRGRVLAFESIINLPKAIEHLQNNKTNPHSEGGNPNLPEPITAYGEDYEPNLHYEGE